MVRAKNIWTAAAHAENMDGGVVVQVGLGLRRWTIGSLGSGFVDLRQTRALADTLGKVTFFRGRCRLHSHTPRLLYMGRWHLRRNAKKVDLAQGNRGDP